jgi:hypothetical protein
VAYADDNTVNRLRVANQTSGPCLSRSAGSSCHEGDGGGDFQGNRGKGDVRLDSDGCLDGDQDTVDSNNRGDGKDFHSTRIDSISLDSLGTTETIRGAGSSGGVPVTFVLVAVESSSLTPGTVAYTFSDGYATSGSLTSGSIVLH